MDFNTTIDVRRLDDEWVGQPRMMQQIAEALADARRAHDFAKQELAVVDADLERHIRTRPADFGVAKVTESSVPAAVLLQPEHGIAMKKVIETRYDVGILEAAATACEHRKRALENLVRLFLADYFSDPVTPEGSAEAVKQMEDNAVRRRIVINEPTTPAKQMVADDDDDEVW